MVIPYADLSFPRRRGTVSCLPLNLSLYVGGLNLDLRQGPGKELNEGVKPGGDSVKWRIQVCLKRKLLLIHSECVH